MTSEKLTISAPIELLQFLTDNPSLSASKVFQGAVQNIMNSLKSNPALMDANRKIEKLAKLYDLRGKQIQQHVEFLTLNNLFDEFIKKYPL